MHCSHQNRRRLLWGTRRNHGGLKQAGKHGTGLEALTYRPDREERSTSPLPDENEFDVDATAPVEVSTAGYRDRYVPLTIQHARR